MPPWWRASWIYSSTQKSGAPSVPPGTSVWNATSATSGCANLRSARWTRCLPHRIPTGLSAAATIVILRRCLHALEGNRVATNTILIVLNGIVNGAGGLVFWLLATRHYQPAVIGVATAGTSMVLFLSGISQFGLNVGIVRYLSAFGTLRRRRLVCIFSIALVAAVLAGMVFVLLVPAIAKGLQPVFVNKVSASIFVASCATWSVSSLCDHYLMARRLNGVMLVKNVMIALARVLFIFLLPAASASAVIGMTGLSGLAGVLVTLLSCARGRPSRMIVQPPASRCVSSPSTPCGTTLAC